MKKTGDSENVDLSTFLDSRPIEREKHNVSFVSLRVRERSERSFDDALPISMQNKNSAPKGTALY
jgi:hypothetical protein